MPAKNIFHDAVRDALVADGWTITHDPLRLHIAGQELTRDLATDEAVLRAETGDGCIAVALHGCVGTGDTSGVSFLLGRFQMYRSALSQSEPTRRLMMAVPTPVYHDSLSDEFCRTVFGAYEVSLLVVDPVSRRITDWLRQLGSASSDFRSPASTSEVRRPGRV